MYLLNCLLRTTEVVEKITIFIVCFIMWIVLKKYSNIYSMLALWYYGDMSDFVNFS